MTAQEQELLTGHKDLSDDALFLAGSLFNMMEPGVGSLTFHMKQSRPTARTQAALDELVAQKAVKVEPFNHLGGLVYTPMRAFKRPTEKQAKAAGKWPITEPIATPSEAYGPGEKT